MEQPQVYQEIFINGQIYRVVSVERTGPTISEILTNGTTLKLEKIKSFYSIREVVEPRHRNDRTYLKRMKGRS